MTDYNSYFHDYIEKQGLVKHKNSTKFQMHESILYLP